MVDEKRPHLAIRTSVTIEMSGDIEVDVARAIEAMDRTADEQAADFRFNITRSYEQWAQMDEEAREKTLGWSQDVDQRWARVSRDVGPVPCPRPTSPDPDAPTTAT